VIYTTNTIESLNMSLRKVTKNRGSFPDDESMSKLLYLGLTNISKRRTMPIKNWKSASFALFCGNIWLIPPVASNNPTHSFSFD